MKKNDSKTVITYYDLEVILFPNKMRINRTT